MKRMNERNKAMWKVRLGEDGIVQSFSDPIKNVLKRLECLVRII